MMTAHAREFMVEAKAIVHSAGGMAKRRVFGCTVEYVKPFDNIVTSADKGINAFVIGALRDRFPEHGIDSEETGAANREVDYVWVLDPIDGTKYYARGLPFYTVSLALKHKGNLVLGIVYAPEFDHMYCAVSGDGATLNDRPILISETEALEAASVYLEIPSRTSPLRSRISAVDKLPILLNHAGRIRVIGVGSLGLCFCATQSFDVYVNLGSALKEHDIAAGRVILKEAGGEFLAMGEENGYVVAGPTALCTQICRLLGS
jgi:myo-inositol-1(or 4)-monophosphatase